MTSGYGLKVATIVVIYNNEQELLLLKKGEEDKILAFYLVLLETLFAFVSGHCLLCKQILHSFALFPNVFLSSA
jgi:hypothetical protein